MLRAMSHCVLTVALECIHELWGVGRITPQTEPVKADEPCRCPH